SYPSPQLSLLIFYFFLTIQQTPISTLFPYTTLFRSNELKKPQRGVIVILKPALALGHFPKHLEPVLPVLFRKPPVDRAAFFGERSEEHTSELQSRSDLVCRLLLEKKNVLIYQDGTSPSVRIERYARPSPVSADQVRSEDEETLAQELRDRLRDSVRAHLVADVPVC